MSGFFAVSRDFFDNSLFKDEPFSTREAYTWLLNCERVPQKYGWLADRWKRPREWCRDAVLRLANAGLVKIDGKAIVAVPLEKAVPAPVDGRWRSLRAAVFARDGFVCTYCGSDQNLACDHIFPRSRGGANTMSNLTTACRSCNSSKRDRTPEEWQNGRLV